jgi:sigma-E factor negative regulatory protein RseB
MWAQFLPDKRRVDVATRNRSFGFIPSLNGLDDVSARHYDITDAGPARLLGRDVQLIRIEPRDDLRYGYRFWLDRQSALPLKFQRVSHDGKVLKEIAFVNPPLLPAEISDDQLKVAVDTSDFRWVNRDRRAPMHNPELKRAYVPQAALLPPGYRARIFNSPAQEAQAVGPRARYIVSDGVSWAEVFIAPATGEAGPVNGFAMGPLASYQLRLDDVQVTVVGEMPQAAAQAIAQAVRPE